MAILVIGSVNVDTTYNLENFPKPGETISSISKSRSVGGKGANQAIACKKLGGDVKFLACVGNDVDADFIFKNMKEYGVDTSNIIKKDVDTGTALINVDKTGQNEIVLDHGANYAITIQDIDDNIELLDECDILILQMEIPQKVNEYAIKKAKEKGVYVILNPAPSEFEVEDILDKVDLFVPNENEILRYSTKENLKEAADELLGKNVGSVIITLGENGSEYFSKKEHITQDAIKAKVVDTTSAGDSYIGAMAVMLDQQKSIKEAMKFATKASSKTVTRKGSGESIPTIDEIM
ncbi:ribokinase [Finegoldia magna]|uniref:ribokinase n=1 Tax=Finegoldia magna TaxID=1260 RepID=UPI0023AA057E|nr:ribokinase [Finegoldia magna]MCC2718040.1 ribokinase [Finegoldia magna]MDU3805463.1 ribokinase [Finegoldia magna]